MKDAALRKYDVIDISDGQTSEVRYWFGKQITFQCIKVSSFDICIMKMLL